MDIEKATREKHDSGGGGYTGRCCERQRTKLEEVEVSHTVGGAGGGGIQTVLPPKNVIFFFFFII